MEFIDLAFIIVISVGFTLLASLVFIDYTGVIIPEDILDDVCYKLTDGEYPIFNNDGPMVVSEFNCINETHEKTNSIKIG